MLSDREKLLVALTVVVIVILLVMAPRAAAVVALVASLAAVYCTLRQKASGDKFGGARAQSARLGEKGFDKDLCGESTGSSGGGFCPATQSQGARVESDVENVLSGGDGNRREGFFNIPGNHPPYAVDARLPEVPLERGGAFRAAGSGQPQRGTYQGAIQVGDYDVDSQGQPSFTSGGDGTPDIPAGGYDMTADDAWDQGHYDRLVAEDEFSPEGNPFDLARTGAPQAASPCTDDEANDDNYDIDERNTYQARSRNDATRATAGTMRRLKEMDKYFREEVEEREDSNGWWGRHEY